MNNTPFFPMHPPQNNTDEQVAIDTVPDVFAPTSEDIIEEPIPVVDTPEEITSEDGNLTDEDHAERRAEIEWSEDLYGDAPNVEQSRAVYEPVKYPNQAPIHLLGGTYRHTRKSLANNAFDADNADADELKYQAALYYAMDNAAPNSGLEDATLDPKAKWVQPLIHKGAALELGQPAIGKLGAYGSKLTGDRALARINSTLGTGALIQTPLWHSGFWVWLRPPTNGELLDLDELIATEKVNLGRSTHGLIFSTASVYISQYLAGFALNLLHDVNLENWSHEEILYKISLTDWYRIIHTLNVNIYPNGYTVNIPCTANPMACKHVETVHVNLAKLFWNDRNALTEDQLEHMSKRRNKVTDKEVEDYKSKGRFVTNKTVKLTDELGLVLRVPSVGEYLDAGTEWYEGIMNTVEEMFKDRTADKQRRERLIEKHARATTAREYETWVEKVVYFENGNVVEEVTDRKDIVNTLRSLSAREDIIELYRKAVRAYINEVTISLVALPRMRCPKCGKVDANSEGFEKHPFLVPLDPVKLFFILRDRRLSHISNL